MTSATSRPAPPRRPPWVFTCLVARSLPPAVAARAGTRGPGRIVGEHRAVCLRCQAHTALRHGMERELAVLSQVLERPPDGLVSSVMSAITTDARPVPGPWELPAGRRDSSAVGPRVQRRIAATGVAAAAAVAIVVVHRLVRHAAAGSLG